MQDGPGERSRHRTGEPDAVWDAFEQSHFALVAFAGPEHRVTAANHAYRSLVGRTDFVGLTVREVFPEIEGQQLIALLDRVYATGTPQAGREWHLQLTTPTESPGTAGSTSSSARTAPPTARWSGCSAPSPT
jgi:hypothetical protein